MLFRSQELRASLQGVQLTLTSQIQAIIQQKQWQVQSLTRSLTHLSPQTRLLNGQQQLDTLTARLERNMERRLERWQNRLQLAQARLTTMNPLATLARGYAIVRREDGRIVQRVGDAAADDILTIQLSDGTVKSRVLP